MMVFDNWQQFALRHDPYGAIPFAADTGLSIDATVGLVCLAAVVLVWLFGG